ncbi:MAG TPA: glycosyltransferase family 4 protein [Candidatus Eisenbacteria bacterium]|nr:glycosyltransferase family 4 protein [Candidatus Eisenbacteria bacterium]
MGGFAGRRVLLVGPVPPPDGGMANQTAQLVRLLRSEGADVTLVPVNAPYRPRWVGRLPVVRALARLVPFLGALWSAAGRADVMHVMANSGWSWHLGAAPAVWIASWRGLPAVVNYRGGGAAEFFRGAGFWVRPTLARCAAVVVPSPFLERVFRDFGFRAEIVPNVVDLARFRRAERPRGDDGAPPAPHLIVARHLEPIYGNDTALRAFATVRARFPRARISIAGAGAERAPLEALADSLGIREAVEFTGRLDNAQMADLFGRADLMLNPSLVDNMPISILESLASGVPVVSSNVGGIPDLVRDGVTASLVAPTDPAAMADAAVELLSNEATRRARIEAGLEHVRRFTWERVRDELAGVYERAIAARSAGAARRSREG